MHDFVRQYKTELDNKHIYYKKMHENVRQNIYDQRLSRKNRLNIMKIWLQNHGTYVPSFSA